MAVNTKWNTSELMGLMRKLQNDRDTLTRNKEFLININKEVETAWQGYAGRTFDKRMDIDVDNIEKVVSGIDALISDLNKVITQCYEPCEEAIQAEITNMRNRI